MRALLPIVLLVLHPLMSGCGTSFELAAAEALLVGQGDATATYGDTTIDFGPGGAPADGRIEPFDPFTASVVGVFQDFHLLGIALMFLFTPALLLDDTQVTYGSQDLVSAPSPDRRVVDVLAPVHEGPNGALVAAQGTKIAVDVAQATAVATSDLPRSGYFGLVRTGLTIGVTRTAANEYDLEFDIEDDSDLEVDEVIVTQDGLDINLGSLNALLASLRQAVHVDSAGERVEVRFITVADGFFEEIGVDFDFSLEPEPIETRVQDAGVANEGILSIGTGMWNQTQPGNELGPDAFGLLLTGQHHALLGRSMSTELLTDDTRTPIGGTTYRGLIAGLAPGDPTYLVAPGDQADRRTNHVVAALLLVGSWGLSIANFDNAAMGFESDVVVDVGNMTDVSPFDGDPASGAAVYVDNSADTIGFITLDGADQYVLDSGATLTSSAWPGASGAVVSAFRHESGDLLFVTDGEPGELWVLPSGASMATRLGEVGNAPRTVRAVGAIAAVGSFGGGISGGGGLFLWVRGAGGTWDRAPFSIASGRSVGIDMKPLPGGRVAVARTTFLGNSLWLTVVDATTGEVVHDAVLPLPAGCTGPGHCAFVRQPGVEAVLVSCNTSDNVVLMPVTYE